MIEEENEDDILNNKISWKKVLKHVVIIIFIILGGVFIISPIIENDAYKYIIGFTFICFGSSLLQIQSEPSEPKRQTLTITKCKKCNITKVRHYEEGDYVYKKIENCDKCYNSMEITQIYCIKLKGSTISNEKENISIKNS